MGEKHSFYFKQFSVRHDRSAMKVGTDAVLLGAWAGIRAATRILDAGTGSGVIALMLAQRTAPHVHIDAIDISVEDVMQARENAAGSPWNSRVSILQVSLADFESQEKYDLIVCNPPFFENSTPPPEAARQRARHTGMMGRQDLLDAASRLLTPAGNLSIVLPLQEGNQFMAHAAEKSFYCHRRCAVFSRKEKKQERWLLEFSRTPHQPTDDTRLVLSNELNEWSDDYKNLMRGFYLDL